MINDLDKLANVIAESNKDRPAYYGMNKDGLFYGFRANLVKTRRHAMKLCNPDFFVQKGLKPVLVKGTEKKAKAQANKELTEATNELARLSEGSEAHRIAKEKYTQTKKTLIFFSNIEKA